MTEKNYIDPKGYWVDPSRKVRRGGDEGGEQQVILTATENCSEAEWELLSKAVALFLRASTWD
jgi:hypothetical protein